MSEWQPIETAPKDGSRILVITPEPYYEHVIADWRSDSDGGGGWASDEVISWVYPTHWMPLPTRPNDEVTK